MKIFRMLVVVGILSACLGIGYYFLNSYGFFASHAQDESFIIRDFNYDRDHQVVDDIFHKEDNWYWMISTEMTNQYSIDFMLKYKTSSQQSKKRDMILKVATVDGKVAGFLAYYPLSQRSWQLLFLLVDQDFRRKGIARKLLDFAVCDMVRRGALRVDIATRNNNFRAQNLYTSYGCKLVDSDASFVHFSWYKPTP